MLVCPQSRHGFNFSSGPTKVEPEAAPYTKQAPTMSSPNQTQGQWTCTPCKKTYKTQVGYDRHMKSHAAQPVEAPTTTTEFREASYTLTKSTDLKKRQDNGIFFTPATARHRLFAVLSEQGIRTPNIVLEPSFGSGEFVWDAREHFPAATVYGAELEPTFHAAVAAQAAEKGDHQVQVTCGDFREYVLPSGPGTADLVLGNPPFVVVTDKVPEAMTGRGNLFVLFVYYALTRHLRSGGVLAFVLPTSFYNAAYYEPCRAYIRDHTTVLHVENLNVRYIDTAQDTMLLVVRNTSDSRPAAERPYIWSPVPSITVLSPAATRLRALASNATTLAALGLAVKTGKVVWNQVKEALSATTGVPVLYTGNIGADHRIVLKADGDLGGGKKQYVDAEKAKITAEPLCGPAILISRGYGNKYKFMYGVVDDPAFRFYGENHTNVIWPTTEAARAHMGRVLTALEDPRMAEFVQLFAGNGAISKTELETVLPIF